MMRITVALIAAAICLSSTAMAQSQMINSDATLLGKSAGAAPGVILASADKKAVDKGGSADDKAAQAEEKDDDKGQERGSHDGKAEDKVAESESKAEKKPWWKFW